MKREIKINLPDFWSLLYLLHNNAYFRKLFYYRIGPVATLLIGWWRPGDKYISFSQTMKLGKSVVMDHPYASVLNAESIGDNFNFRNLTTIGSNKGLRPKIGNNVTLGANVTIIGNITIGNNVFVGAGSIVVKDVPDNCIVAGNPAKIIRYLK